MGKETPSSVFSAMTILPSQQPVLKGTQDTQNANSSPKKKSPSPLDKAKDENEKLNGMQLKLMKEKIKCKDKKELFEHILNKMKHTGSCLQETCTHIMENNDLSVDLDNDLIPDLPAGNIHGQTGDQQSETKYNPLLNNVKQETWLNLPNNNPVKNEVQDNSVHDVSFKPNFKYDAEFVSLNDLQLSRTSPDAHGDQDFSDTTDDHNKMALSESNESYFDSIFLSPYQVQQYGDLPFTENDTLKNNLKEEEDCILAEDQLSSEVSFDNLFENDVLCNQHNCQSPQKANNGDSKQANKRTHSSVETLTQSHRTRYVKRKQAYIIKQKQEAKTAEFESVDATEREINVKSKNSTDVDPTRDDAKVCKLVKESLLQHTETGVENVTTLGKGKETNSNAVKKAQTSVGMLEPERHSKDNNVETNSGMLLNIKEGLDISKKEITTAETCKVDSSKQETANNIGKIHSVNEEITISGTTEVDDTEDNITTYSTAKVDRSKQEITTAEIGEGDSSKQEITTVETGKIDSSKQEITTAETGEGDSAKQEITTVKTGKIDSYKQEITTAETGEGDRAKQEITTVGTGKADSSKQEITTADTGKVDSSKQEKTTIEIGEGDTSKQEITTAEISEGDSSKQDITTDETDKVDSSKKDVTTDETGKVDSSKQELTSAVTAQINVSLKGITTGDKVKVDISTEEMHTTDTTKYNISSEGMHKNNEEKETIMENVTNNAEE